MRTLRDHRLSLGGTDGLRQMRTGLTVLVALSILSACSNEHAELEALNAFYKSDDPKAKACAQFGVLVAEAHSLLGPNDPAEVAAKQLETKYHQRVKSDDDRARVSRMMLGVSNVAYGLRALSKDGAIIAYLQTCRRQSAGWTPATADRGAYAGKLRQAEDCERNFSEGAQRKDCIARAFGGQT